MIRKKQGPIEWLEFELLQAHPEITHAVFLRTLDFADSSSLAAAKDLLNLSSLVSKKQVHGDAVERADSSRVECDGIMTSRLGEGLLVRHADCQAALFYDPLKGVVANVHCGWRGQVQNIYQKAVERMSAEYGSHPKDLLVCISPSLGPRHAEFIHFEQELPSSFLQYQVRPTYFDFWEVARAQLEASGVNPRNIEIASMCTFEEEGDFFSYRRGAKTSRHGTVIALNNSARYD